MQVEHYTNYITGNPKWELAGIYADDGISGTNTKKRDEFNRMIEDSGIVKLKKKVAPKGRATSANGDVKELPGRIRDALKLQGGN